MRRVHHKTRTGCTACKKRRVKCDERKPSCLGCERNNLTCSLEFLTPVAHRARQGRSGFPLTYSPPLERGLQSHALDLNNFELLHHYTSHACLTLGADMAIWQELIPQLAFSNNFLMHSMLAVSALHLAHLQPQRKSELTRRASIAESKALAHYARSASLQDPTTIHAALAFGGFIVPYIMAQSEGTEASVGRIPSLNDSSPHWFHVIRGLVQLAIKSWPDLIKGPFGPLMTRPEDPVIPEDNPDDTHLLKIYDLLGETKQTTAADAQALATCRNALEELRRVAAAPHSRAQKLGILAVINVWPGTVPWEFLLLLHQRRPEALVILAHYCVLLKKLNSNWYLAGIGEMMISAIEESLDARWTPWIQWAIEQPSM